MSSPWISGFRMTEPMSFRACAPAFCTFTWESLKTSINLGTMLGRQEDSCLGAQYAIAPSNSTDPKIKKFFLHDMNCCSYRRPWKPMWVIRSQEWLNRYSLIYKFSVLCVFTCMQFSFFTTTPTYVEHPLSEVRHFDFPHQQ